MNQDILQQIFNLIKTESGRRFKSYRGDKQLWTKCPFPHASKSGEDTRPSMMIKPVDNNFLYYCTSCKNKGNAFTLVKQLRPDKIKELSMIINKDVNVISCDKDDFEIKPLNKKVDIVNTDAITKYNNISLEIKEALPFFKSRGIEEKILKVARCKYSQYEKRLYFPIMDIFTHDIVGLSSRTITDSDVRWKHMKGFDKTRHLYFIQDHLELDYVILVEGISDVLNLYQKGYIAFAILGASVSMVQAMKIIKIGKPVKILFDGDSAGRSGSISAERTLYPAIDCEIINCPEGKDPGCLEEKEICELLGEKNGKRKYF